MNIETLLRRQRLLITAGSGGVGKTTTAAALAVRAALQGRRAAVLTIDPARRLADALGLRQITGELRQVDPAHFTAAGLVPRGELWAMMLDTKTTGDQMVRRFAPDEQTARNILQNTYYQYFSTSLAGAQEYMAIEQVRELVEDQGFDLVVLDTPPAVHALDFLDAPDRLLRALESPAMQMLRRTRGPSGITGRLMEAGRGLVLRSFDRLTGGPFLEDLAVFLTAFGSILDAMQRSSKAVQALLRASSTCFLLVTAPFRSNVDEAIQFRHELRKRGFPFGGYCCNRVHTPYPSIPADAEAQAELEAALHSTPAGVVPPARRQALLAAMLEGLWSHNRMAERDREAVRRLAQIGGEAPVVVPLLPQEVRDLQSLDEVGGYLTAS